MAEQEYLTAAKLAPTNPDVLNSVAEFYHDRSRSTEAVALYSKVAAISHDYADVYTNLALCYKRLHNYPLAFANLQTQMKLTPNNELAKMAEGDICAEQNMPLKAAASYAAAA